MSSRANKFALKYDAYVLMLRAKHAKTKSTQDFLNKTCIQIFLEDNLALLMETYKLPYGLFAQVYQNFQTALANWGTWDTATKTAFFGKLKLAGCTDPFILALQNDITTLYNAMANLICTCSPSQQSIKINFFVGVTGAYFSNQLKPSVNISLGVS
jgi:hypothetical protein